MDDLTKELARSCAKGKRQLAFVNELLQGGGFSAKKHIPYWNPHPVLRYGFCDLDSTSWKSLQKRLVGVGFHIRIGKEDSNGVTGMEMSFDQNAT